MSGNIQQAKMLKSSQDINIEDCNDTTLPGSTGSDGTIQGAATFAQLGPDAYLKLLDARMGNLNLRGRGVVIIYEIHGYQWIVRLCGEDIVE